MVISGKPRTTAVRNAAVVRGLPEITIPPAEHLGGPAVAVSQHESERPEAGDPMVGIVQAELRAQASDLPLRGEFGQGKLDQALHLFRKQHAALLTGRCEGRQARWVPR